MRNGKWIRGLKILGLLRYVDSNGKEITNKVLRELEKLGIDRLSINDIEGLIRKSNKDSSITNRDIAEFILDENNSEDLIRLGQSKEHYDTSERDYEDAITKQRNEGYGIENY